MPSFQISITPSRREAARFIARVRRAIQMALAEENQKTGATQSDLARSIGVHRSVINRELRGQKDITLGRVAELAYALGRKPYFELREPVVQDGANWSYDATVTVATNTYSTSARSIPAGVNMVALDSEAA